MLSHIGSRVWSMLSSMVMMFMLPATSPHKPLCGYDSFDVNFGRFYKAATQTSKQLLKEVFVLMMHRSHVCYVEKWPTTVAEYCFIILSWSKTKYRDSFNAQERELMEQPVTSSDFDVSLMTKMIHKLFAGMKLSESLSRAIRDLKNVRNRVCHEYQVMDNAEVRDNFDDLKMVFENLFMALSEFFSINVSELQEEYQQKIDEIQSTPSTAEASEYFEKAELFQADLVGKFISLGRQELINYYVKLKSLNPFTWLSDKQFPELLVEKIFTPLSINEQSRTIEIASILNTEILNEETKEVTGILPTVLIMSGIAGCGKTSLCRYFLHDWRTKLGAITTLRSVDVLIHIEIRNVTCNSLVSYLQRNLLQETLSYFEEKDIINILQQINVLYIIDGIDEATAQGMQLVNDVLSFVGNSRVILTTRPEFSSSLIQSATRHHLTKMRFCIQGFSKHGVIEYTSRVFTAIESSEENRNEQESKFLQFLHTAGGNLGDQLKLPLTVALLICLWKDDHARLSLITCVTRLYFEIFRMCTMKLISRVQAITTLHHLEVEAFSKEWLLSLGKVAYRMLDNDEYVISNESREFLVSLCTARQIDSIQVLSAYLSCDVKDTMKGIHYEFSFIHKSQMEYLAAMHLASEMTNTAQPNTSKIAKLQRRFSNFNVSASKKLQASSLLSTHIKELTAYKWSNTMNFTVGHLCINNVDDVVLSGVVAKILESQGICNKTSSLWQIVQESECHPIVCKLVGNIQTFVWHPTDAELCDPMDPTVQLLQHTNFKPEAVHIRIVDAIGRINVVGKGGFVERRECTNVLPVLSSIAQHPSIIIVLRLDQHYYNWGSSETSDVLLTTLLPKCNLVGFMGHVGAAGADTLAGVRKLSDLYLRVSDPAALKSLKSSLSAAKGKISQVTLRLDIPPTVLISSLPTFKNSPTLSIIMRNVDDACATWAAEVLAQLSLSYKEINLVASNLTPSGGETFLKVLIGKCVDITDNLTIRSCHVLEETQYKQMSGRFRCSFEWWY